MYLSRIKLQTDSFGRVMRPATELYRSHQLVWQLFDENPDADRSFLYREIEDVRPGQFYVLSDAPPRDKKGQWSIETKPFHPVLKAGQLLHFELRANPVNARRDPDLRLRRHDVIMDRKRSLSTDGNRPSLGEVVQEEGLAWLRRKASLHGFEIIDDQTYVKTYESRLFAKPAAAKFRLSIMDFVGMLKIVELEKFQETLTKGIGRAKAFGCGLLLVRPYRGD